MDHVHDPHGALIDFMIDLFVGRTTEQFRTDCARHVDQLEPDLVINSFSEIGGPLAAEAAGVPHVMFLAGADDWFERCRPAIEQRHGDVDWLLRGGLVVAEVPSGSPGRAARELRRCLGHAGWGTVTACAAAGVPMAALVLGADHDANAVVIERVGFGVAAGPEDCTPQFARAHPTPPRRRGAPPRCAGTASHHRIDADHRRRRRRPQRSLRALTLPWADR